MSEKGIVIEFEADLTGMIKSDFEQAVEIADAIIKHTKETGDPYPALEVLRKIERLKNMTAIAKAKVLHFLDKFWYEYQIDVPFIETVQTFVGLNNSTVIKRYIKIWDLFETNQIPKDIQTQIRQRPIKDLVPIMGALNQGYEISDDVWESLIYASDFAEVARIVREDVRGAEPRSHAINYRLDRRDGSLYAINQGAKYHMGRLNISTSDPIVKTAILRAVNKLGIEIYDLENEND